MKKLFVILSIVSTCSFAAITNNLLTQFRGPWSNSLSYRVTPIKGIPYYACPEIIYSGATYICNGSAQPNTAESTPNNDTAYTVLP